MSKPLNRRIALRRSRPDTPDPVERVAVLTRTARGAWLGLLAYLAFVGVTLMGVEDADFFLPERRTDLPLIGVSVPTSLFFYIAPFLGAMLYIHLHLYLLKLWKALGELPSGATRPAGERIPPWIVSDMALAQRAGAVHAYPLRSLARWVAILSIFAAGPAVLAAFWWRSMPKHDEALTILACGLPLFASTLAGWESWRALRRGGAEARHMPWRARAGWGAGLLLLSAVGFLTTEGTFAAYAQVKRVNLIVTEWEFDSLYEREKRALVAELEDLAPGEDDLSAFYARVAGVTTSPDPQDIWYLADRLLERRWWMRTWLPDWLRPAQLQGVAFVETPPGWLPRDEAEQAFRGEWCADQGVAPLACGPGPLAKDEAGDRVEAPAFLPRHRAQWCRSLMDDAVPGEDCKALFAELDAQYVEHWREARATAIAALPGRDLSGADLRGANLRDARMEGADLTEARIEEANVRFARMEGATLRDARMEGATLRKARMEGADLSGARLKGANLREARMEGANLLGARMEGANLSEARMEGADLSGALMEDANLGSARMEGADLEAARMEGAYLREARMEGADLGGARMEFAKLGGARMEGAALWDVDLSMVVITQEQVTSAFGDASVALPKGMASPVHWLDWNVYLFSGPDAFETQWRKWRADPEGYTPPPQPER